MTREEIIHRIADDVRKQIERRINDYSDRDLRRYPPETGNYESEQTTIDYCLDIYGGKITEGVIYNKNGWPYVRLTEYLNENFPDLSADISRMLEDAGVVQEVEEHDRIEIKETDLVAVLYDTIMASVMDEEKSVRKL